MLLNEKINLKYYLGGVVAALLPLSLFLHQASEWIGVIILLIGIFINQIFHIYGIESFLGGAQSGQNRISILFILSKTVILAISVIISVQFLEKKLFIAVIVYLYMLMLLSISLKRDIKRD
jgi:hypothetical protein